MENIERIREQFPVTKNKVFMNHAAQSPLPKPVTDAVRKKSLNKGYATLATSAVAHG